MSGFVKLDTGIQNSSVWINRDLRSLFLTSLVMAEPFEVEQPTPQLNVRSLEPTGWVVPSGLYGLVRAAGTGIVRRDGMTDIEAGLDLLESLCSPDGDSRSQEFEGRRMARVNGGYVVLNYFRYREHDYGAADRMRKLRARQKEALVTANSDAVTPNVTHAEAEAEAEADAEAYKDKGTTTAPADDIDFVLNSYRTLHPLRRIGAKQREIVERALKSGRTADELVAAVEANAADQWHRDHDKHELSYVLADGMIDTFIALKHDQATASTSKQAQREAGGRRMVERYGPLQPLKPKPPEATNG